MTQPFIIISDATEAYVDALLFDFEYTPDIDDQGSRLFLKLQRRFCTDVSKLFYGMTYLVCQLIITILGEHRAKKSLVILGSTLKKAGPLLNRVESTEYS